MTSRPLSRLRDPAGSATVLVLAGCLLVGSAAAVTAATGEAVLTRHRAFAAADAAALAAAAADLGSPAQACAASARAAAGDGARLQACSLVDGTATVTVTVRAPGWLLWLGAAKGRARAGRFVP